MVYLEKKIIQILFTAINKAGKPNILKRLYLKTKADHAPSPIVNV